MVQNTLKHIIISQLMVLTREMGPFDPEFFDSSFDTGDLIVELSDDDSTALGAKTLSILQLAEATIVYWEKKIRP